MRIFSESITSFFNFGLLIFCFFPLSGQELVADINPDTRDGYRGGFRTNGEEAIFIAYDPELGTELYKIPGPNQDPTRFFDEIPGGFFQVSRVDLGRKCDLSHTIAK